MTIRVALNHRTSYQYDRVISLGPHTVRLRPAPHCRTPILSYSLQVEPADHFCNWQQDPFGNYVARLVFPKPAPALTVNVDLVADMTVINPFDFFLDGAAEEFPFTYEPSLARELRPFLEVDAAGPKLAEWLETVDRRKRRTVEYLVDINAKLQQHIDYLVRLEPGVQTQEETLTMKSGSCRDTSWLLVTALRHQGLAARFVSGYLIQLTPDVKSLDGPSGTDRDFTDLHAWAEVYLPGAGWVGLDPTSGLFAGEGHLPLACTASPTSAAPISGMVDPSEVSFEFSMSVERILEDPRVTKPYTDAQWERINVLGREVDQRLTAGDVRLTMGGEPTFVSIDDMDGSEWNSDAVGPNKRRLAAQLIGSMRDRFAPGGLLHFGQGKWYPGESLPRWAFSCFWRTDGQPLWIDPTLIADESHDCGFGVEKAREFAKTLCEQLGVVSKWVVPVYEDVFHYLWKEQRLPKNVSPLDSKLKDPEERARIAHVFERGVNEPVGFIMPLRRPWWQAKAGQSRWSSGPWPVRPDKMFLLPGDSPIGLRLPLDALPHMPTGAAPTFFPVDPLAPRGPLPERVQPVVAGHAEAVAMQGISEQRTNVADSERNSERDGADDEVLPTDVIRTALCVEPRDGRLYIFMPPVERLEDYLDLLTAVEETAAKLKTPVVIEGYLPPHDHRLKMIKVTPDPGVIEVNIHPASSWDELVHTTTTVYDDAHRTRLGAEKFDLDGKHTGTGGGNHVVLGGPTPADSPFLRRPDLLRSLVAYWNNHPSLSYLFSGRFVGPTSQAPRADEGRADAIYELQLALAQVPDRGADCPPWLVDRIFRNLLIDLTGNTHRAEFCIDKLYSPDSSTGRLGLVEFRGFEMPPHAHMSLTQQLLIRSLVAWFNDEPYRQRLVEWGTALHDRFMLPHFVAEDFADVIADLNRAGVPIEPAWFAAHHEFRFPLLGRIHRDDITLELHQAIEPWNVLGEEPGGGGTVRFVDSSIERIQVCVTGMTDSRHIVTCNGRRVPLKSTGQVGEFVAAVRFRAWQPPSCLHPTIPVHTPLVFDLLDTWNGRSLGGCRYHVSHPGGLSHESFPVNSYEAEGRRAARFEVMGHTVGPMVIPPEERNPRFPLTLDMRRG